MQRKRGSPFKTAPVSEERVQEEIGKSGARLIQLKRDQSGRTRVEFRCQCGAIYEKAWGGIRSGQSAHCWDCSQKWRRKRIAETRRIPRDKVIERLARDGATLTQIRCDRVKGQTIYFRCACGVRHKILWGHLSDKKRKAWCRKCAWAGRDLPSGPDHPHWVHDRSKLKGGKFLWSTEDSRWKKEVLAVFDGRCAISGVASRVTAHHLLSRTRHPEFRFDVRNGVALTRVLHREFHARYCRKSFTPEDFLEFYREKTGVEFKHPLG